MDVKCSDSHRVVFHQLLGSVEISFHVFQFVLFICGYLTACNVLFLYSKTVFVSMHTLV